MPPKKNISYEDFDQAIKAAYSLGKMQGEADMRTQMEDLRQQLTNVVKTNHHLLKLMMEDEKNNKGLKISPTFAKGILGVLRRHDLPRFCRLNKEYERATGKELEAK